MRYEPPAVMGGQGRSDEEIEDLGADIACAAIGAFVAITVLSFVAGVFLLIVKT